MAFWLSTVAVHIAFYNLGATKQNAGWPPQNAVIVPPRTLLFGLRAAFVSEWLSSVMDAIHRFHQAMCACVKLFSCRAV